MFISIHENSQVLVSSDLNTWNQFMVGKMSYTSKIAFGNGIFAITGDSGIVNISKDGKAWNAYKITSNFLSQIKWLNGQFIVLSGGSYNSIFTSKDGEIWSQHTLPANMIIEDFTWSNDRYILSLHDYQRKTSEIFSSTDLTSCQKISEVPVNVKKLVSANGILVALVYEGTVIQNKYVLRQYIMTSKDGVIWSDDVTVNSKDNSITTYDISVLTGCKLFF